MSVEDAVSLAPAGRPKQQRFGELTVAHLQAETPTWRFIIPVPSSLPTANSRLHWAARSRLVKAIRVESAILARNERRRLGAPAAIAKRTVRLTLVRGKGQRTLDYDQVYAGLKPVLDSLTDAEWIVDDSPRWIDYRADQVKANHIGPAVIVEITPIT